MKRYNVLVLTDHTNHSKENSLYSLIRAMFHHPCSNRIDVASRGNIDNQDFFEEAKDNELIVSEVGEDFQFSKEGNSLLKRLKKAELADYDLIWLRIPPPMNKLFTDSLTEVFQNQLVINNPKGMYETGSKEFLLNFQELCPSMRICNTKSDIIESKKEFPIVLKPFREYGGNGIVRIDGNRVWSNGKEQSFESFINQLEDNKLEYLSVKFLSKVSQGDKRIVVVDGKILGASLRMPPKNSWLCNAALGGTSNRTTITDDEIGIIQTVDPILSKMGIVMYGLDTLVDDNGKRVLSEINTTSIGGLLQIAHLNKLPVIEQAIDLIWEYFLKTKKNEK